MMKVIIFVCMLSMVGSTLYAELLGEAQVRALAKEGKSINVGQLDFIQKLPLPSSLAKFLNNLAITAPQSSSQGAVEIISGNIQINQTPLVAQYITMPQPAPAKGRQMAFSIALPKGFRLSSIDSSLKPFDVIALDKGALVFSEGSYKDSEWNLDIIRGLNFIAVMAVEGEIKKLIDLIPGANLNQLQISGIITPKLVGSRFTTGLPGQIKIGTIAQTTGIWANLYVVELQPGVPDVAVGLKTGLAVNIPGQKDPLDFEGEITVSTSELFINGYMNGLYKNAFGIPGLEVGNTTFAVRSDYTTAVLSEGILAISGACLGGEVGIGSKTAALTGCMELSEEPDLVLIGKIDHIQIEDLAVFAVELASRVHGFADKSSIQTMLKNKIPEIGIDDLELYLVPKDTLLSGKVYQKGVSAQGGIDILGQKGNLNIKVNDASVVGLGTIVMNIGPFSVTGPGSDGKSGTPDDAATLNFNVSIDPKKPDAQLGGSGLIKLDVLDGLAAKGTFDIGSKSLGGSLMVNLFNKFQASVEARGVGVGKDQDAVNQSFKNIENWTLGAVFTKEGTLELSRLLGQAAKEVVRKAEKSLNKARRNVKDLDDAQAKIKARMAKIDDKIRELEDKDKALNDKNIKVLTKAQANLDSLKVSKDRLNTAIAQCKGKNPKVADDIDNFFAKQPPLAPDEVQKAAQALQADPDLGPLVPQAIGYMELNYAKNTYTIQTSSESVYKPGSTIASTGAVAGPISTKKK